MLHLRNVENSQLANKALQQMNVAEQFSPELCAGYTYCQSQIVW